MNRKNLNVNPGDEPESYRRLDEDLQVPRFGHFTVTAKFQGLFGSKVKHGDTINAIIPGRSSGKPVFALQFVAVRDDRFTIESDPLHDVSKARTPESLSRMRKAIKEFKNGSWFAGGISVVLTQIPIAGMRCSSFPLVGFFRGGIPFNYPFIESQERDLKALVVEMAQDAMTALTEQITILNESLDDAYGIEDEDEGNEPDVMGNN